LLVLKRLSALKGGIRLKFVKTQALGNDFILVEREWIHNIDLEETAPTLCNRNFGIGSDGILIVDKEEGLYRMTMLNPDGSEAMCGNGLRAFIRYLIDEKYVQEDEFDVLSLSGKNRVIIERDKNGKVRNIKANLGYPVFERDKIPYAREGMIPAIDEPIEIEGRKFNVTLISMGNPHAVIFVDDIEEIEIEKWGPQIENHPLFPKRTNVEFVQFINRENLIMRVWERGAGVTLACGTGTSATVVAAVLKGMTGSRVKVHLLGGILEIEYEKGGQVWMIGPASEVFRGEIYPENLYFPVVIK
jgi:diaminopimelate epimerase